MIVEILAGLKAVGGELFDAAWSLLLLLCFIVGLCYGDATNSDALSMLSKYRELLFIPIVTVFLNAERSRYWAWNAFILSSVLILLISYLMHFGVLDLNHQGDPAFKSRITHSIFISLGLFNVLAYRHWWVYYRVR